MTEPASRGKNLSALPSPLARALAFSGIILGGVAGALIGYALVGANNDSVSEVARGLGVLLGGLSFSTGTAVIAVLVLRAIGEWRDIGDRR